VDKSAIDLILRVLDYIVTISFGYILYHVFTCIVVVLNCFVIGYGCMCGFCNVCVLVICILAHFSYLD